MAYIAAEDILKAKEMDLMTYLRNYEPQELVHVSGNTYCTREHDSLRISNGKWYWFSQDIGGRSALDYLIKVKGLSFMEAVEAIIGRAAILICTPKVRHIWRCIFLWAKQEEKTKRTRQNSKSML